MLICDLCPCVYYIYHNEYTVHKLATAITLQKINVCKLVLFICELWSLCVLYLSQVVHSSQIKKIISIKENAHSDTHIYKERRSDTKYKNHLYQRKCSDIRYGTKECICELLPMALYINYYKFKGCTS